LNVDKLFAKAVRNWPAKVLSLALAIILFIFHRMITLETRFFSVPIAIENLNTMVPSSSYPRMIRVSIRGEANSIYSVLEDDVEVYVDMNKFSTPGTYIVPVQWRRKGTAQLAEPMQVSVDPMEITLSVDHRRSKFVPVVADFVGQVETGYNMTSFTLNPNQIVIDGPAALMDGVSEVFTEQSDLSGRISDFNITAAILQRDPLIVIRGNGLTELHGTITQIIPVRNIQNVPIEITGLREDLTGELDIKSAAIRLEGSNLNTVTAFEPSPGFLSVDCSDINEPGIYTLSVFARIAENLRIRVDPVEVRIQVVYAEEEP
jgi:YbbR domain-containing protein